MRPRAITGADMARWSALNPRPVVRVAWELDEIELARLAKGGTLWLSTWGGLPVHMLEVVEP